MVVAATVTAVVVTAEAEAVADSPPAEELNGFLAV